MISIILLGLFMLVPIAIIGVIVFIIYNAKDSISFHGKIRTIYMYLIAIITLVILIIGAIGTFNSIMDLCFPTGTENYGMIESPAIGKDNVRNRNIQHLFGFGSCFVISMPLFVYHIKAANRTRKGEQD